MSPWVLEDEDFDGIVGCTGCKFEPEFACLAMIDSIKMKSLPLDLTLKSAIVASLEALIVIARAVQTGGPCCLG